MCTICATFNPYLQSCEYTDFAAPDGDGTGTTITPVAAPGDETVETTDAAGGTGTAYSIEVGEFFMGELGSSSDSDWVAIDLVAGQTYTFAVAGTGALSDSNDDPYLRLRDASGSLVTEDDDGGPGRYSSITFTASSSGTYYLDVQSWDNRYDGTYGLSAIEGTRAFMNAEMAAGVLLRPDEAWTAVTGTGGADVTWAIRASGNTPDGETFIGLSAAQIAATEMAMAYVDAISGLDFTQVNPGGSSNNATILFGAYDANDGSGAYAYYPGSTAGGNRGWGDDAGNVWLNNNAGSTTNLAFGSYSYFTILHEIGHAIGLAHPGDYNATPGVNITYAGFAQYSQDTHQYTVMSYFDESYSGATGGWDYPDTFMLHDYLAIHTLYGADTSYNAGNTVYGFNTTETGTAYDFVVNSTPFLTIYDGSGTDTVDLSGYAMDQMLSLQEGAFSDVGGYEGRFSIAYGAVIENAIGGSGNDLIWGNGVDNTLEGGLGRDTIYGDDGHDNIMGGDDKDRLFGNKGDDTIDGGTGHDRVVGGNGDDELYGGRGNDAVIGGRGEDTIFGDNGNDFLLGGTENDTIYGGVGDDILVGAAQSDYLDGQSQNDSLYGGGGFDTLIGGEGDDVLNGGFNADIFIFEDNHGDDIIEDFEVNTKPERIDFSGLSTLNSLADVIGTGSGTAAATQVGLDVVIETGSGTITLVGVDYSDLDADDFIF